jgi:methylmalonyl-CoA mutase C-terminal domain/subunit
MKTKDIPIRVLMAKTSLDAHWVGLVLVSTGLRDAGMEVIYGRQMSIPELVQTAIQEDVDVIGLSLCGRRHYVSELMKKLRESKADDKLVIAGGFFPPEDAPFFKEIGIAELFPPGSTLDSIISYIKENVERKREGRGCQALDR